MQWEEKYKLLGKTVPHEHRNLTRINYAICYMPTYAYPHYYMLRYANHISIVYINITVHELLTMEDWLMTFTTAIGGVQCVIEVNDLLHFLGLKG
jgi:hypothetical protein